jgi:FdhD protein
MRREASADCTGLEGQEGQDGREGPEPRPRPAALASVEVVRVRGASRTADRDCAAVEEPLEVRLHGRPFAVIMRTPGADRELALGFLLAERVIRGSDDVGAVAHCTDPSADHPENIVDVTLVDETRLESLFAERRQVTATASCGLCGRRTIESLTSDGAAIDAAWTVAPATLAQLADRLRSAQRVFDETGGLHAAGLFTPGGTLVDVAEDVGRHNAVDKVIGRALMQERLPLSEMLLFVSGRSSFEIVQKAFFAGIPIVASVSAPSSLAIQLAGDAGITLAGFVRGDSCNVYAHPERLRD